MTAVLQNFTGAYGTTACGHIKLTKPNEGNIAITSACTGSGHTAAGSRLVERIHRHWEYASCWERVSRQGFEYSSQAPQLSRAVIILSRVQACSMTSLIRPSQ